MLRFSAHPTTVGSRDLQMTAEYPGYLQTTLEKAMPNTTVAYLGGSLGSSGPRAPDGTNDIDRAQAMGKALANLFEDKRETGRPELASNSKFDFLFAKRRGIVRRARSEIAHHP
jgi:hypothetical protein